MHRLDGNHQAIVDALRRCGALVLSLTTLGAGAPDVLVCFRGRLTLLEIKMPDGELRPAQQAFLDDGWPVKVVTSVEQALVEIGAYSTFRGAARV